MDIAEFPPNPSGTALGLVVGFIKAMHEVTDRNDLGSQTILTLLAVAQAGNGGLPQSQLVPLTGMTMAGVSRNVTRLSCGSSREEGWGWVESREDPMNRRYKIVTLTYKGKKVLEDIFSRLGRLPLAIT